MKRTKQTETVEAVESSDSEGLELLQERLSEKLVDEDGYGFDPMIIIAIIGALIPLIQNCFNASPKSLRRRSLMNRARVAAALRQSNAGWSWSTCRERAELLFDMLDEASDSEVQSVITACQSNQ